MQTAGTIRVEEKIDGLGKINDISGKSWEIISVWPAGEYVTASETSEISDTYARFRPYDVEVIKKIE